jgi:hypothetical protein
MSTVEGLVRAYERFVRLPWDPSLAGPQKVWFALYEPAQERRLRLRVEQFETATKAAGHGWALVDLTDAFAQWMGEQDYRDAYFEQPDLLDLALQSEFTDYVTNQVTAVLTAPAVDANTVVAMTGLASLFGLIRASALLEAVAPAIRGRLLVFFPGQREGANYRLLDARDGWNYLAVPIEATNGG